VNERKTYINISLASHSVLSYLLCKCYIRRKLHKSATQRVRSRLIASTFGYFTWQISHFFYSQLVDYALPTCPQRLFDFPELQRFRVWSGYPRTVRSQLVAQSQDNLWRWYFKALKISCRDMNMTTSEVPALYPSINIDDGGAVLVYEWIDSNFYESSKPLHGLWQNTWKQCKGFQEGSKSFLQKIGTAMGPHIQCLMQWTSLFRFLPYSGLFLRQHWLNSAPHLPLASCASLYEVLRAKSSHSMDPVSKSLIRGFKTRAKDYAKKRAKTWSWELWKRCYEINSSPK
jgi:hypothetical protein